MPRPSNERFVSTDFGRLAPVRGPRDRARNDRVLVWPEIQWTPNRRVLKSLPPDFSLRFRMVCDSNGNRQIFPATSLSEFLIVAAASGLAILHRTRGLSPAELHSYRLMSLVFQWSFSDRRLMKRQIKRSEDLWLKETERQTGGEIDVLPDLWEKRGRAEPVRWTPTKLVDEGAEFARERGNHRSSVSTQIELGLLRAAKVCGREIEAAPSDSAGLIRLALFGYDQGTPPSASSVTEEVECRLLDAVRKHQNRDADSFADWMWRDVDNLIQQLSKRRTAISVDRQTVRYVLFDLLWRSLSYVSGCVQMQMQLIRLSLAPLLNSFERRVFGLSYDAQPWTGGLAPIMLHKRLGLLFPTLEALTAADVGDGPWRDFLQALAWQSEIVNKRRAADRNQKRQNGVKTISQEFDIAQEDDQEDSNAEDEQRSREWRRQATD